MLFFLITPKATTDLPGSKTTSIPECFRAQLPTRLKKTRIPMFIPLKNLSLNHTPQNSGAQWMMKLPALKVKKPGLSSLAAVFLLVPKWSLELGSNE